jgi:hypothetical protein
MDRGNRRPDLLGHLSFGRIQSVEETHFDPGWLLFRKVAPQLLHWANWAETPELWDDSAPQRGDQCNVHVQQEQRTSGSSSPSHPSPRAEIVRHPLAGDVETNCKKRLTDNPLLLPSLSMAQQCEGGGGGGGKFKPQMSRYPQSQLEDPATRYFGQWRDSEFIFGTYGPPCLRAKGAV